MNVTNINSGYGGSKLKIHSKHIKQEIRYLGPHEQIIEVGDEQNMSFQEGVDVPFCINPQEHVAKTFSRYYEISLKYRTKAELIGDLEITDVDIYVVKGKWVRKLQYIAYEN